MVQAIGRDNIKLCFDTFHIQMEEGNIAQGLKAAGPG